MFVTIDLDGVLIQNPFNTGVFPKVRSILAPYLIADGMSEEEANKQIGDTIQAGHGTRLKDGRWVDAYDWDDIVNEVAQKLGHEETIDIADLVVHFCRPDYIAAYEDTEDGLQYLRDTTRAGSGLYWLSNGFEKYQRPVMEALQLQPYFDGYTAPDIGGGVKPHGELFHDAAQRAKADLKSGIHIGDMVTHDVAGARRVGMKSIWIDRKLPEQFHGLPVNTLAENEAFVDHLHHKAQSEFCADVYDLTLPEDCIPDAVIASLSELPAVIEALRE